MEPVKVNRASILHFCKPWFDFIVNGTMAMFFAVGLPGVVVLGNVSYAHSTPMNPGSWMLASIIEIIDLGFAALFLYMSGPEHLTLDVDRHTYRYVFGWPLLPQVHEGTWEDMAGVYVWDMNSSRPGYAVGISWKGNKMRTRLLGTRSTLLATFNGLGRLDRAKNMASEISHTLGLPLVEPPFPMDTASDTDIVQDVCYNNGYGFV